MAKQTFTTGQVLTAAQMTSLQQTAMSGGAASAKTASYTLVAADAGGAISMSNASATTITVNTGLFAAGDTVHITNLGAGVCTITAGTATVNSSASLALAQYESGFLDFTSTSAAIFVKGAGASGSSSPASAQSFVTTKQTTSSTSYTGLSTAQAVTLTTGTKVMVCLTLKMEPNSTNQNFMSYAISGSTTKASADSKSACFTPWATVSSAPENNTWSAVYFETVTAGSNTFTAQFRVSGGTGYFLDRQLLVIDLGS